VAGALVRSGEFEFDLAGLITFADGSLLVCKDARCAGDFPHCNWDELGSP
jgi:hypothetical protein